MQATWAEVKKELIAIAHAFDVPITEQKVRWYCEVWKQMEPAAVLKGLHHFCMSTKSRRLPLPGEITDKEPGELIAGKIIMAVRKYGYTDPRGAMNALGDVWMVVQMMGGWDSICKYEGERGVLIAQCRDLWDKIKGATNGTHGQLPGRDKPADILEGAPERFRNVVRGLSESTGSYLKHGVENPPDGKP